jgi:integrase
VSEATGADIEHLGLERGHRTLVITRKGGKVVIIPLAPRTARAIDLATGERTEAPLGAAAPIPPMVNPGAHERMLTQASQGGEISAVPGVSGSFGVSHLIGTERSVLEDDH